MSIVDRTTCRKDSLKVSYENTVRATKAATVATQTHLTWVNKTGCSELKDKNATETGMDGTNDCDH